MRRLAYWLLFGFMLGGAAPAQAIWLSESGGAAWLSGSIEIGDEKHFKEFLERPRAQPLRVLYLSSGGGHIQPAFAIGRMVRRAGLVTVVEAARTACSSACTFIFAGGARRHYVGGEAIFEGASELSGLGFHPARYANYRVGESTLSERGTASIRAFYAEMGMPRATELMEKAAFNSMYRPNGATALALRIATSLSPP
jgi:hypothetical protein